MSDASVVFVVEDDADVSRLVCHHLDSAGYASRCFTDSSSVIEEAEQALPSLFLLDIAIPGADGFELCRRIRQTKSLEASNIIFLTARSSEKDRVKGFEIGGDDYVTKPFSPRELLARIRAVLRSSEDSAENERVCRFGQVEINGASMTVRVRGEVVRMTAREFKLLDYVANHPSRILTREQLLAAVWPTGSFVTPRSVDVYVRRVREKVEADPGNPIHLKTVKGMGYRFEIPK